MNRNIEEILKKLGSEDVPADVHKIAEETSGKFSKTLMQSRKIVLWENIMRSRITRLAAAAVIVIAVIAGVSQFFGGTVTFADVIQPILNARTVVFDFIVGDEANGPVIHDVVVDSRIRRTFSNMETILIIDLDSARMLTLDPEGKGAVYVDIKGPLEEGTRSFLGFVRDIVAKLEDDPNIPVQQLEQQEIDGQKAVGFLVKEPNLELTIWANPKTALPIRIELRQGRTQTIIKNIEFDVPVENWLVSMDVPAGYTLQKAEFDMREFKEEDFIETLRLWAKLLLDGRFPDSIGSEEFLEQTPRLGEKIGQLDIPDEQKMQLSMQLGRANVFFQFLSNRGGWHYAGKGVKLGDSDTPIFWYQPKDSETWRVIYGDLTVGDVTPENLPK